MEALHDLGIYPSLELTSAEVSRLSGTDVTELRELGATDEMIQTLRRLADVPDRLLVLDFEKQVVSSIEK